MKPILSVAAGTLLAAVFPTSGAIVDVVETGGDNEATDTITAKWTGVTYNTTIANEPILATAVGTPYTVGVFGSGAPAFVDRAHRYFNEPGVLDMPPYLVGNEYIMSGNDNRENVGYRLDVTVDAAVRVYMLIDNRLSDGAGADPPTFGVGAMQWILDEGWVATDTGHNRAGDPSRPDELPFDEGANDSIEQYYSVYYKDYPAGTFALLQADNAERNMYGVVVVPQSPDADGDGLPGAWENANGLNDNDASGNNGASGDPDGDGLDNLGEFDNGTNPQVPDTDGDGVNDGEELSGAQNTAFGNEPTNPLVADTDGDDISDGDEISPANGFVTNPANADSDRDGADDGSELAGGTDPLNDTSFPSGLGDFIATVYEVNGEPEGASGTHETGIFFDEDVLAFTDRPHQWNGASADGLPRRLVGGDYVMSANDARDNVPYSLTLRTQAACTFYVLWDNRVATPLWFFDGLDLDFEDTGLDVGVDEDGDGVGPGVAINQTSSVFLAIDRNNGDSNVFAPGIYEFPEQGLVGNNMYGIVATIPLVDVDGDGLPEYWEIDNGLDDSDATGDNGASGDPDGDGLDNLGEFEADTDPRDPDTDADGLNDGDEVTGAQNPWLFGAKGPLPGEPTDPRNPDSDGDGLTDFTEVDASNGSETDPNNFDTDFDGLDDSFEVNGGLDPEDGTGENGDFGDPDGDGLDNFTEQLAGGHPNSADTDGDGLNDGDEWNTYFTELDNPDTDGDGLSDGDEVAAGTIPTAFDTDGDGEGDGAEIANGTDPLDPLSFPPGLGNYIRAVTEVNGQPEGISGSHLTGIFFGEDVASYTDRVHEHNGADASGLPGELVGADYVMPANDSKGVAGYQMDVFLKAPASLYVLLDNRFAAPPAWFTDGLGLDFVDTGLDTGIDEGAGGIGPGVSIENTLSVWIAQDTANGMTTTLVPGMYSFLAPLAGNNMYAVLATAPSGQGPGVVLRSVDFNGAAFEVTAENLDTATAYQLRRSSDGQVFTNVGGLVTPAASTHTFTDPAPPAGTALYQLATP